MGGDDLERTYAEYIAALNARRLDLLGRFVHDDLTYNGEPWTLAQYRARLADDVHRIPDLHYAVRLLVAGQDQVASRLWFDCSPRGEFLGAAADGRRVRFAEHAFYRFRDGRVAEVWSVIDVDDIRRQLARPGPS